ncbi:MAG: MG2 domain-containing protein [Firmicutes bacterium]|nr:MG2 domain-containing protein [Bacillota bacterium]
MMSFSARKLFVLLICFLVLSISVVTAEEQYLYGYTENSKFYSPGQTYRPTVSFYSTNQKYLDISVYKLDSFKLKDGNFSFAGNHPGQSGKKIYSHRIDVVNRTGLSGAGVSVNVSRSGKNLYTSGSFRLPSGKNGIYYLIIQGSSKKFEQTFVVSPLGMIVKHSPDFIEGIVFDQKTDKPVSGVSVKLFDASGPRYEYKTDSNGFFRFSAGTDIKGLVTVIGKRGEQYAAFSFSASGASDRKNVYFFTERPVYRPGHKVYFKGVVTELQPDKTFRRITDTDVVVVMKDSRNSSVGRLQLKTNSHGSFNGEFDIPETTPLGRHYLSANIEGREYNCMFDVQEYRKPEFEVFVNPEKTIVLKGEEARINVRARYFYGNPVKGGKITYTIEGHSDSLNIPGEYDWDSYYYENNPFYANGTAILDESGNGSFTIKLPPNLSFDQNLTITCSVTDKTSLAIEGFGMLKARIGNTRVAVGAKPYCVKKGGTVNLHAYTADNEDKPVSSLVKVVLSVSQWNSKKRKYDDEVLKTVNIKTDETGHGYYDQVCPKTGYVSVKGSVQDSAGNFNYAKSSFYVYSGDDSWYSSDDYSELKIITDKKTYSPGDKAKLLILTGSKGMSLYVTLEQDKMYKRWIIPSAGNATSFEVPILPEFAPGVYVKACYVSKGNFCSGQAFIDVPVKDKFINLKISSDKQVYTPGDTAFYEITAGDTDGKPVQAEVSLGVVDDAIYAIMPESAENIRSFFYGRRPNLISTNFSTPKEYPGGSYQKVPEKKTKTPDVTPRKKFKDTTFWNPVIMTDEKGYAKIPVELAENLTRWRATARAFSDDVKVGQAIHKITARKDLTVRLASPRFFRYKDHITVSSIVSNDSKSEQQVTVAFSVKGAVVEGSGSVSPDGTCQETLTMKAGGERVFNYRLNLNKWNPDASITIKATAYAGENLADGVLQTYPLLPYGQVSVENKTAAVTDSFSRNLNIPEDIIPGTAKLQLSFAPSLGSNIMGTLDYLAQYPYGCVEQTMSRFLPLCIMKESMQNLGIESAKIEKQLPPMVKLGFAKLYGYQHPDGGWGWWKDDDTHPFLTAYVLYGFYMAEKAGYKVEKNVIDKGLKSLEKQFDSEKDPNTKAFMLYSLSLYGKAGNKQISSVSEQKGKLNNYGLALLALSCLETGDKAKTAEIMSILQKNALREGSMVHWKGSDDYGWMCDETETTCWVLSAYLKSGSDSADIHRIIEWIISRKSGDHWVCTKTTGYVVMALSGYLRTSGELDADFDTVVKVNGKMAGSWHFDKKSVFEPAKTITLSDISSGELPSLKTGNNTIEIEKKGEGRLYYTENLLCYRDKEPEAEGSRHFAIEKYYWVKDGEKYKILDRPVKTGEEVLVELKITPDRSYEYIMVEDPLPSGFEVKDINKIQGYYYTNAEARDNRMVYFQTYMWSRSRIVYSYIMRAERPGNLNVMPATVELMYKPEIRGGGLPMKINVEEEQK